MFLYKLRTFYHCYKRNVGIFIVDVDLLDSNAKKSKYNETWFSIANGMIVQWWVVSLGRPQPGFKPFFPRIFGRSMRTLWGRDIPLFIIR